MTDIVSRPGRVNWLNISLWTVQVLLALGFGAAGLMKLITPIDTLSLSMAFAADVPEWLTRFIGAAEVAGAIGVILPALTRIRPWLTPLAAAGFAVIQVLAIVFHATRGELAMSLPANLVLLALSLYVIWGRTRAQPISPRA